MTLKEKWSGRYIAETTNRPSSIHMVCMENMRTILFGVKTERL